MDKVKILLVDDHKIIRDGIKSYLEDNERYEVVGEASNGIEAIHKLNELSIDIVVMDINMEGLDGIEATKRIRDEGFSVKIVGLTMLNDGLFIKQMIKAGANGYVLKNCTQEELITAFNTVLQGGNYYSSEVTNTIMNSFSNQNKSNSKILGAPIPLTNREIEVLKLICKEFSNSEIADKLFISPRTVDAHKRNLLEKTGSKNVAGLVLYAINAGITEEE